MNRCFQEKIILPFGKCFQNFVLQIEMFCYHKFVFNFYLDTHSAIAKYT